MPRNSSGAFSLAAGNPVVTGTAIASSWANTTLNDIAAELTDSLDRSGKGAMLAALLLIDGAVGGPGLGFANELSSGLYRAGAGDVRLAVQGADVAQLKSGLLAAPLFQALGTGSATLKGTVADGAAAVANILDNSNSLVTTGAKILSLRTAGAEKAYFDLLGGLVTNGFIYAGEYHPLTAASAILKGAVADGATAVGAIVDNVNALATAGAKLISFRSNGVEKAYIDLNGNISPSPAAPVGVFLDATTAAGQSIPTGGTDTTVVFGTVNVDTDSAYNSTTGTFTVPTGKGGHYHIDAGIGYATTANTWNISIYQNATQVRWVLGLNEATPHISATLNLAAGDTITIRTHHSNAGSLALAATAAKNWLSIKKVI